jgi:hypothetical protein
LLSQKFLPDPQNLQKKFNIKKQYLPFKKIMALVRKSAVSTKSSWFRRDQASSPVQPATRSLSKNMQTIPVKSSEQQVKRSRRKRTSMKNISNSLVKDAATPTLKKESVQQTTAKISGQSHGQLPMMSTAGAAPVWLLRLYSIYRYSSGAAFILVAGTLMVYGWTVYSQELWSQAYRTLQGLQRHERQLKTANATLTSKMAKEGEASTQLVLPTPGKTIFLQSKDHSPNSSSSTASPSPDAPPQNTSPLGY